ncbi:MAG: CDP-alcohol phosphatidyltransferase family protein [Steroidobacteraceae bacterium]
MSALSVPNALSFFRLFGSPLLLPLSQAANQTWLVVWFILLGASDALDGALARRWNQTSDFGSKLDAIADLVFYPCSAIVLAVLFPAYLIPNLPYVYVTLTTLAGVLLISRIRCGRIIMLHTHISRYSGVFLFAVMLASFFIDTTLLIRMVALAYSIGFIEASLIFLLRGPVSPDTRSLFYTRSSKS